VQDLGVEVQRRRTVEVGDGVDRGCARAPGSHGSTRGGAVLVLQGLERSEELPMVWNCRGGATHRRRRLGRNSGTCEVETEERGLGVDLGHEMGLMRQLWWDVAQQGGRPSV
jgi:hypothetical protein